MAHREQDLPWRGGEITQLWSIRRKELYHVEATRAGPAGWERQERKWRRGWDSLRPKSTFQPAPITALILYTYRTPSVKGNVAPNLLGVTVRHKNATKIYFISNHMECAPCPPEFQVMPPSRSSGSFSKPWGPSARHRRALLVGATVTLFRGRLTSAADATHRTVKRLDYTSMGLRLLRSRLA